MSETIQIPAIKFSQGNDRELYSFVVDGKKIPQFANIVRIGRDQEKQNELFGYQRPEVFAHIKEIRRYLESENPLMPNALVIAFDRTVDFDEFTMKGADDSASSAGVLNLPCSDDAAMKIGWIVDGQQRTAAIRDSSVESFPVSVVAFVANQEEQREQFILVNSTKPLPKDLIYELLPSTNTRLALPLQKRKLPAQIVTRLNYPVDSDGPSPFAGRIKTPTNRNPDANISYNSVLKLLEHSLSDGTLMHYTYTESGEPDVDGIVTILNKYWGAVADTFPTAWKLPPTKSRLTHGAGMVSMGFMMDAITERADDHSSLSKAAFRDELERISDMCKWTEGAWNFSDGPKPWNDIQNLPKDIEALANYLLKSYLQQESH
jgi:DGQHR domain-containing protein